jgi:acyl-CoA thioesterase I
MTVSLKILLTLFLIAISSACGGGGDNSLPFSVEAANWEARAIEGGPWVVMGSSSAAGAGAVPAEYGWAQVLKQELAPQVTSMINLAKGGTLTSDGLSAIDQALDHDPVLLLVSYPSNDTGVGYSIEETVRNILAIRTGALARAMPVIVLSSQPRNDFSAAQLAKMTQIDEYLAFGVGPCFVEVRSALSDAAGWLAEQYSYDGVHPNNAGHGVIAERVRAVLDGGACVVLE